VTRAGLRAAIILTLLLARPAAAAKGPHVYDPEIALLLLTVQMQSVSLVRDEMTRQAEWLDLGAAKVLLSRNLEGFTKQVRAGLSVESDVVEDFRRLMVDHSPGAAGEIDRLVSEIRRYHDLVQGPPLERVPLTSESTEGPVLSEEAGVGADVTAGLKGPSAMDEPVAYAERRFGTTGPFLRRRLWNLDFYLGSFADLVAHYRKMGYRRAYRLRSPYVSYGKSAYVLSPEPGLRPRLIYCGFYGRDMFLHTRAQWAVLTAAARGQGPAVRTIACSSCAWVLPGVKAMKSLLATVPFDAAEVVVGYDHLFAPLWQDRLLGVYENDYWRLAYYHLDAGVTVTVQARHTNFGEILASSLTPLVKRGARQVFFGGPAAKVDPKAAASRLARPAAFLAYDGSAVNARNILADAKGPLFSGLPSPLLATHEWMAAARKRGVTAFDGEMSRLAEEAAHWKQNDGSPVELGLAAVLGGLSHLHPEEDRALYTVQYANQAGREALKKEFRDAVVSAISAAGPGKSR